MNRVAQVSHSLHSFDALAAAQTLFGDTSAANLLLVGAAYQTGALRLPLACLEEAVEINGVAVEANLAAFRWGRVAVADPTRFEKLHLPDIGYRWLPPATASRLRRPNASSPTPPSPARSATWSRGEQPTWSSSRTPRWPAGT